jgi:hypothetical protein
MTTAPLRRTEQDPLGTVAQDIAREDAKLDRAASRDKHRAAESSAELSRYRWEMTVCEFGPAFSQRAYADLVGRSQQAISLSVKAWQRVLDADKTTSHLVDMSGQCAYGGRRHHQTEAAPAEAPPPTESQTEDHSTARHVVSGSEIKALAVQAIARQLGVSDGSADRHNRAEVNDLVNRLNASHVVADLDERALRAAVEVIALEIADERKLAARRERDVATWMQRNRAVDKVQTGEVRKMLGSITRAAERKGISWDDAATEAREWDWKFCEAERSKNEMIRRARVAVLKLQQQSARVHSISLELLKITRKIQADDVPVSADEQEIVLGGIDAAAAALRLARAAFTGESGTDWDREFARLTGTEPPS